MTSLANQPCEVCRVGAPLVTEAETNEFLVSVPEWGIIEERGVNQLVRRFCFSDFVAAIAFADRVGELAEEVGHHPKLVVEWGKVAVFWWTHKIDGLHKTDFIMAAKTDQLLDGCATAKM